MPAPAQAKSKTDGLRNVETTDFSARRYWRGRYWHGPRYRWGYRGWRYRPFFPLAFAAAAAAPRYYWGPRYYRPAYYPYYPRYRYWRRPGVSISFGFGPRWWW